MIKNIPTTKKPGIYMLTNLANGKRYIGQTSNLQTRIKGHLTKFNGGINYLLLQEDYDKGCEFSVSILEVMENSTKKEREDKEEFYILKYETNKNEYNLKHGTKHHVTTRRKMSEDRKGENNSMFGIQLLGEDNGMFGKRHKDSTKQINREKNSCENSARAKLTNEDVLAIVNLIKQGFSAKEIASNFNTTAKNIYKIKGGDRWANLTGGPIIVEKRK